MDRDYNAAVNIREKARRIYLAAWNGKKNRQVIYTLYILRRKGETAGYRMDQQDVHGVRHR